MADAGGRDGGSIIPLVDAGSDGGGGAVIAPTPGCTALLGTTGALPPGLPFFLQQTSAAVPSCKQDAAGLLCGLPENALGESYAVENGTPTFSGTLVVTFDFEFLNVASGPNLSFAQLQVQGSNKVQLTLDPTNTQQVVLQFGAMVSASLANRPLHRARVTIQPVNKLRAFPATLLLDGMEYKFDVPATMEASSNLVQLGVYHFGVTSAPLPRAVDVRYPRLRVEACP